jgi:hypothetical protein
VNVLFARMRGAARTTDTLRNFWKERSAIEEEYAKSLMQLAQSTLGKDEIGELRNAFDTLQLETEKLANTHLQLASSIRTDMEEPTTAFLNKQIEHRRNAQVPLEKKFKSKLSSESHVAKAREKYQGDCVRIATYTAQLDNNSQSLEAEKIRIKLKHAKQTVGANEKDYASFTKALGEMIPAWENEWKNYCDSCQDLEEERLDFMKDHMWAYANAVSTVCVADDESCETIRTVLDQLETERDVEYFVHEYGTGNSIPNAPEFVPYNAGSVAADGSSSTTSLVGNIAPPTVSTHPAVFKRQTRRPSPVPPYAPNSSGANAPPTSNQQSGSTAPTANQTHRPPSPTRNNVASPPRPTANNPPPPPPSSPPQVYQPPPPPPVQQTRNGYGDQEPRRNTLPPQPTDNEVAAPIPPAAPATGTGERNKILFYGAVSMIFSFYKFIDSDHNQITLSFCLLM